MEDTKGKAPEPAQEEKTEEGKCLHIWIFDGLVHGESQTYYDYRCAVCGEHKLRERRMVEKK